MEKEVIVLIHVYYPDSGYGDKLIHPPLGIAYISEFLEEKEIDHYIVDMGLGYTKNQILEKLNELKPKWVGISLNSLLMNETAKLIKAIRGRLPNTFIIVGGPHVTTQGLKIFEELPEIDYAIVGEGEESFYEIITDKDKSEIKGLIYRDENSYLIVNKRRITEDLNEIPFPKFKKFELNKYESNVIPLLSSRGCPFKCIFCQQSSLLSKSWRGVSPEYFIENIKYWLEKGYNQINVIDDNFIFSSNRLIKIVELYEKEKINNIKLHLIGGIRISHTNQEVLLMLKKLGVELLAFGIESIFDPVLKFIRKGTTEKQIKEVIKKAIKLGFKVKLFLIIGFPYQTIESLNKTYKFIMKHPIYDVKFFNLIPYENTELMNWLKKNGRLIYQPSEYMNQFKKYQEIPIFEAKDTLSVDERVKQINIAKEVTEIVKKRSEYLFKIF